MRPTQEEIIAYNRAEARRRASYEYSARVTFWSFIAMIVIVVWMMICPGEVKAQTMYEVKYKSQADLLLYEVKYASQADIRYYPVQYRSQANERRNHWYWTEYASQARYKVYWVKYKSQADRLVYEVRYPAQTR